MGNRDLRMKAEHVKTPETAKEVSSHGVEKRAERHKGQQCAPLCQRTVRKEGLQTCGAGRKSRKRPTLVVGKNPNEKSQLNLYERMRASNKPA
jgi:aspartate aminotransferase-like enzyme